MALSEQMQAVVADLDARLARVDMKARREARFSIKRGEAVDYRTARDFAREAGTVNDRTYWNSYAAELVRQGKR